MRHLGIGLLGTGFMGRTHTYAYRNILFYSQDSKTLPDLIAVFSRKTEKTARFKEFYGFKRAFPGNWKKVIDDEEVDVVDNVLPNFMHYEPCMYALEKGKHVICEKPLTVKLAEARSLYETALKADVKTMTVFNYRFLPAVRFMKEFIELAESVEKKVFVAETL